MKNKGFTFTELLAVICILAILIGLALLGVSRYRIKVDKDDLKYLHSTFETNYNTYREEVFASGGIPHNSILVDSNDDTYKKYLNGLSYDGKKLKPSDVDGSIIELHKKGEVLNNSKYVQDAQKRATKLNGTVEDIYVIDATCKVKSEAGYSSIVKTCEGTSGNYEPSIDDLVCIKVKYKNRWIIDDFGKDANALIVNDLCKYIG